MAFIRTKKNKSGNLSYHVVQSKRDGSKVRQEMLCYLGSSPTIGEAIAAAENRERQFRTWAKYSPCPARYAAQIARASTALAKLRGVQEATGLA